MYLTEAQQKKVSEHIRLVQKVINDKIHGTYQLGMYSYEDIFQIGCIGLCKAAATDKGGTFSTYAYRLIWNEICDALLYATRRQAKEVYFDLEPYMSVEKKQSEEQVGVMIDLEQLLSQAKADAPPSTGRGIEAMKLMAKGYTSREIGERMGASDKLVCAWVSNARKFLKKYPKAVAMAKAYCLGV